MNRLPRVLDTPTKKSLSDTTGLFCSYTERYVVYTIVMCARIGECILGSGGWREDSGMKFYTAGIKHAFRRLAFHDLLPLISKD
jgi:hypothetical protein